MITKNPDEIGKLHCLHSLFDLNSDADQHLAEQIKSAIDLSLAETEKDVSMESFAELALQLCAEQEAEHPSYGLFRIDLTQRSFDPLWIRGEVVRALKHLAGYDTALLMITGLRASLCPTGRRWSKRKKEKRAEAIEYIDELAVRWSHPGSALTIMYL